MGMRATEHKKRDFKSKNSTSFGLFPLLLSSGLHATVGNNKITSKSNEHIMTRDKMSL